MNKRLIIFVLVFLTAASTFFPSILVKYARAIEYPEFPYTAKDLWQEFVNELSNGVGMGEERELLNVSEEEGVVTYNYHGYVAAASKRHRYVSDQLIHGIRVVSYEREELFNSSKEAYSFLISPYPLSIPGTSSPPICYSKENYTLDDAVQAYINDQKRNFEIEELVGGRFVGWSCNYQVNLETYSNISIVEWFFAWNQERMEAEGEVVPASGAYEHGLFIVLNIKPINDCCYSGILISGDTDWEEGRDNLYDPDALREDMRDWVGLIARMLHKETGEYAEKEKHLQVSSVEGPSSVTKGDVANVNVTLSYNFSQSTASYVAIQNLVTGEDIAFKGLSLSGSGNLTLSFQFLVNESATLHLSAYALYLKDGEYVHDEEGWYMNFDISVQQEETPPLELVLEARTDKQIYITREKVLVTGKVTYGSKDMSEAQVTLRITLPDGTVVTWPGGHPNSDGSFTISYEIPTVPFTTIPPQPEDWNIEVTAAYRDVGGNLLETSTTLKITVLPIWLEFHEMHLVQAIEIPLTSNRPTLAAGKEAGIRTLISCPSFIHYGVGAEALGITKPRVKVEFSVYRGDAEFLREVKEVEVGLEPTPVDFIFKLPEGTYYISVFADSDSKYMDITKYLDDMLKGVTVNVKKMKALNVRFVPLELSIVPVELDRKDAVTERNYLDFCVTQEEFMKNVYPLPEQNLIFFEDKRELWSAIITKHTPWQIILPWLSLEAAFEGEKIVGVTPADWWKPGEQGISLKYVSGAVAVKYGATEGATAHEIAHTLGLNRWVEEYKAYPEFGKEINGLILKDGKIYNVSDLNDRRAAFFPHSLAVIDKTYCFMGTNLGFPKSIWVCDETYSELFKRLTDPPDEKVLYVSGTIYANGTIKLDNWYILEGKPDPFIAENQGKYTFKCLSSNGEVLYNMSIGQETEEPLVFSFLMPFPDETSRVVISDGENILAEVPRSENAPSVSVPQLNKSSNGLLEVSWSARDLDGDELRYSVLYSNDGGETWICMAIELNETKYRIDPSQLPGGNQCLVKIIATDGFNTGYNESEFFTVANKAPSAFIRSPKKDEVFQFGEEIVFKGIAYDPEGQDGLIAEWSSNLDGILGYGETLQVANLSEGTHEITFTVMDSNGNIAEDKMTLTVKERSQTIVVEHALCRDLKNNEPVDVTSTFTNNEMVYCWLKIQNGTRGDTISWIYLGPSVADASAYTLKWNGEGVCYSTFNLAAYNPEEVIGEWTVTVYVNDREVLTEHFTVKGQTENEPSFLTGLLIWEPLLFYLILFIIAVAVITVSIKRRNKRTR